MKNNITKSNLEIQVNFLKKDNILICGDIQFGTKEGTSYEHEILLEIIKVFLKEDNIYMYGGINSAFDVIERPKSISKFKWLIGSRKKKYLLAFEQILKKTNSKLISHIYTEWGIPIYINKNKDLIERYFKSFQDGFMYPGLIYSSEKEIIFENFNKKADPDLFGPGNIEYIPNKQNAVEIWRRLDAVLQNFRIVFWVSHGVLSFASKQLSKEEVLNKIKSINTKHNLKMVDELTLWKNRNK